MHPRRYLRSTPRRHYRGRYRFQRGSRRRNSSPGPTRQRGSPRLNRFRRPARYSRADSYSPPTRRHVDRRYTPFGPRRSSYWRGRAGRDMSDTRSHYQQSTEANFSPCPTDSGISQEALLTDPHKRVPAVVSPNTRERSFSEIMNGAFDLEKSPKDLGKKLVDAAESYHNNKKFQNPFRPPPANRRDCAEEWSTPTRASKRNASAEVGPMTNKHAKSTHALEAQPTGVNPDCAANISSVAFQTSPVTVGYARPQPIRGDQSPELLHLLELVRQNTERSKELCNMVEDYIKRHSAKEQEAAPINEMQESLVTKDIISSKTLLSPRRPVEAVACGGGSPDPPRDNLNNPRGHMVDKSDVSPKSACRSHGPSCDGTNDRQSVCGSESGSRNDDWTGDEYNADICWGTGDPWDFLLPRQMSALDLRSAANDDEDLTRTRHRDTSSRGQFEMQSTSYSKGDSGSTRSLSRSRRLRTSRCPSPETPVQVDLDLVLGQRATYSADESHFSFVGKTLSRRCSSPGVAPDISPIRTPKSSVISIHLNECPSARASDVHTPDRVAPNDNEQHRTEAAETTSRHSPSIRQWNPYATASNEASEDQDYALSQLGSTVFQQLPPALEEHTDTSVSASPKTPPWLRGPLHPGRRRDS